MVKSTISIIKHIPLFLNYCKKIGLSKKTQENYGRFLKKFMDWLKIKKLESIKPHELTAQHVWDYRLYLSRRINPKTNKTLQKTSQNYYLIALRALLGYFMAKDIICLPPDKITLPKAAKAEKTVKFLNLEQINKLLSAPDIKTLI